MSQNSPKLHRIVRIYFFTFMVIVLATNYFPLKAQHYPVRVNTIVTPPYSSRLSDYVESGYDRVQLLINPLDMNLVDYKVKVKLIIESLDGRVLIQTDPNYLPPPVYLNGGVTEFLTSYDIQALFDPKNLIFVNGITKNEYLVNKRLPENYYRIGFILLDYNRATLGGTSNEVSVSNFGYTMAGMFLNDPPILNLPQNGIKQTLFEPQQIVLQWTPRHKGSPNSAFSCEYVVRLYEAWNEGYSAAAIVQTQMPIFETVTNSNRYVYGIADPMLIPGKKYVWTIQARDAEGRDMFRNNGLSEAFMFTWGDACLPPANFKAVPVNGPGMELKWSTATGHTDYDIRYRIAGSDGEWYEQNSMLTNARISSLRYNTTYEVSVKSNCGIHSSDYTLPVIVKMSEEPEQTFMCGTAGDMAPVTSTTPITVLPQGAIFYAGGFECHVVEARATERGFSGTCYVVVPFYGFAKVLHTFENIRINLDLQMFSGKLLSVADTVKGNALMTRIDNALTPPGSGFNNKQVAQILGADTVIVLKDRIKNVEVNNQGQIVVTYNNGKEEILEVEEGTTAVISDRDGEQYYVDNGNVSKARDAIESAASSASQQVADAVKAKDQLSLVRFAPGDNMNFGFDSLVYPELRSQYMINTVHGQEYVLPYKSVATGAMDVVDASMPAGGFSASGLSFRINHTPVVATPANDDNVRRVNVTPLMRGGEQVLEAVYTLTDTAGRKVEETLGQLNVVAYDKQVIKLYVVPVGRRASYSQTEINSVINRIYSQAVVEWNIEWLDAFETDAWDINNDKVFDDIDEDDRMDYTPEMKSMIRAFKDSYDNIDRQAVYVFLFNGEHRNTDLKGYMPFNKQFAFVFTEDITTDPGAVAHHISHEIAHGTFNLRHTFSDRNRYIQSRSTTHNLMDYSTPSATILNKYQWDLIHDPQSVLFSWLEDEGEGEVLAKTYYWTPAGTPIFMPSAATTLLDIVKINSKTHLNGILYSWKESTGITYIADIDPISNRFYGYIKSGTSEKYADVTNLKAGEKILVNSIMYIGNCTKEDVINEYTITENIDGASFYTSGRPLITEFHYTNGKKANALTINNCTDNIFTGKAKDFKNYCTGKFNSDQTVNIDKTAGQIQLMGDFYNDYEKLVLSTNPYSTWINTPENLNNFYAALAKYYEEHKNTPLIENPNCPDCPKYPIVGDSYWDDAGRNWVFVEGDKWRDLSGEFCEEEGCNNEWKSRIDVQAVHKAYYDEKLRLLENDSWQRSLGINEEFKKNLWRATQFATVQFLKENWTAEQVGDSWWNLLFGNIKSAFYKVQVANGDQTFYASAALDGVFGAVDIFLLESIAKNLVWKFGIKYLIIEGGAKQLSQHVYYSVCKQAVTYRLAYALRFGTPDATAFFEKQLTKTIEIYDNAAGRYIKFDPATGEVLSGKFVAGEGQSIVYESYGKISVSSGLTETEQAKLVATEIPKMLPIEWIVKESSWKPGRVIRGNTSNPIGVIGNYEKDTKQLILDIGYKETTDLTYSQNGIKLLNTPKTIYKPETFWTEYNEPWLKGITDAKADVAVLSNPTDDLMKYQLTSDGQFKLVDGQKVKTGFGKEIDFMENLVKQGKYKFNESEGIYKYIGN